MNLRTFKSASELPPEWDSLSESYFQQAEFLLHCDRFNPCRQRYYLLEDEGKLLAGAVIYTLRVNILTFARFNLKVRMNVLGVPASVSCSGLIGAPSHIEALATKILELERGLLLGMNYTDTFQSGELLQLRTLPGMKMHLPFKSFSTYVSAMRHPYRRRILKYREMGRELTVVRSNCAEYTDEHQQLYLNIMRRTSTKLETLSADYFRNLPNSFKLTSYYQGGELQVWHICHYGQGTFSFFFGGINYTRRDKYASYFNNLAGIVEEALLAGYQTIDLGQTAEIPKMRLGAKIEEKRMFLHHSSPFWNGILKRTGQSLAYKGPHDESPKVFRDEYSVH